MGAIGGKEAKSLGGEVGVIGVEDGVDPATLGRGIGVIAKVDELVDERRKGEGEESAKE